MDICTNELYDNKEKIEKNISYLGDNGKIFQIAHRIKEAESHNWVLNEIKKMIDENKLFDEVRDITKLRTYQFNIGLSVYMVIEYAKTNNLEKTSELLNNFKL